jgi:protein-disulfide isomerase
MFCIVSFIVLSILGIFSASNRSLAKEALDCVLRRVTFRPCTTGFDEKMKAKILGVVIMRSETLARLLNKYFEALAWAFFALLLASSVTFVRSLYLYYVTGSCNGLNQAAFCVFDPSGANNQVTTFAGCVAGEGDSSKLTLEGVDLSGFPTLNPAAPSKVVFIGCYTCDYTRKVYDSVLSLVNRYQVGLVFLHYPVNENSDFMNRLGYCAYQQDPAGYWRLNEALIHSDKAALNELTGSSSLFSTLKPDTSRFLETLVSEAGLDAGRVLTCVNDPVTESAVKKQMNEIVKTGFYGTPTLFIGSEVFVGPKPYRVYAIALKGLFFWLRS